MGLKKFFNNLGTLISGKSEEAAIKLVEQNPEAFLNEAIENDRKRIEELKNSLVQIEVLKKPIVDNEKTLRENLVKIQVKIRQASNSGNRELEIQATERYKLRAGELDLVVADLKEIKEQEDSVFAEIKALEENIKKSEADKNTILANLKLAKSKEEIMKLTGQIKTGSSSSADTFNTAKGIIEKQTQKARSTTAVHERFNGKNSNEDPLAGL